MRANLFVFAMACAVADSIAADGVVQVISLRKFTAPNTASSKIFR